MTGWRCHPASATKPRGGPSGRPSMRRRPGRLATAEQTRFPAAVLQQASRSELPRATGSHREPLRGPPRVMHNSLALDLSSSPRCHSNDGGATAPAAPAVTTTDLVGLRHHARWRLRSQAPRGRARPSPRSPGKEWVCVSRRRGGASALLASDEETHPPAEGFDRHRLRATVCAPRWATAPPLLRPLSATWRAGMSGRPETREPMRHGLGTLA